MAKNSRLSLLYLTLVALALVLAAMVVHNNRGTRRMAQQIFGQADAATSAATSLDEARAWLVQNQFHVVTTADGVWASSYYAQRDNTDRPPDYLMVRGHRKLRGFLPIPTRWIAIIFRFHPDGTFDRVLLDDEANAPPLWSVPAAGTPTTAPAPATNPATAPAVPR